ncbi:hypothetical protein [Shewanella aestuarii]|uniref:Uncharacterized protein n=1 Tax=Shewanella aestuarii TaxID=1028752 RepID=A0A6G9QR63_9GAMM|nr:hypothetical protein [Shewanella aestuarii]QIR16545.1 hypothetical protein HBH39_18900 [Shewanella aestuarii]
MAIKEKTTMRLQFVGSTSEEVAFINFLQSLRGAKYHVVPSYVLQLAMIGFRASDSNLLEVAGIEKDKVDLNGLNGMSDISNNHNNSGMETSRQSANLELTDSQIQDLAKNIAIEMKRLNIAQGVNSILAGNDSPNEDAENQIEEEIVEIEEIESEQLKSLKGTSFF